MSFCFKCGKELDDSDLFCPYCGTEQKSSDLSNNEEINEKEQSDKSESIDGLSDKVDRNKPSNTQREVNAPRDNNKRIIIISVIAAFAIGIVVALLIIVLGKKSDNDVTSSYSAENTTPSTEKVNNTTSTQNVNNNQSDGYKETLSEEYTDSYCHYTVRYPKGFLFEETDTEIVTYKDQYGARVTFGARIPEQPMIAEQVLNDVKNNANASVVESSLTGNTFMLTTEKPGGEKKFYYYIVNDDFIYSYIYSYSGTPDYEKIADDIKQCAKNGDLIKIEKHYGPFTESQINVIKQSLSVPLESNVVVKVSDPWYWDGAGRWLVHVGFTDGSHTAGADCDSTTGEICRSILPWDYY